MTKPMEIQDQKLAEFKKCVTIIHEPDKKRVLDTLHYIMSMPGGEEVQEKEPDAG